MHLVHWHSELSSIGSMQMQWSHHKCMECRLLLVGIIILSWCCSTEHYQTNGSFTFLAMSTDALPFNRETVLHNCYLRPHGFWIWDAAVKLTYTYAWHVYMSLRFFFLLSTSDSVCHNFTQKILFDCGWLFAVDRNVRLVQPATTYYERDAS